MRHQDSFKSSVVNWIFNPDQDGDNIKTKTYEEAIKHFELAVSPSTISRWCKKFGKTKTATRAAIRKKHDEAILLRVDTLMEATEEAKDTMFDEIVQRIIKNDFEDKDIEKILKGLAIVSGQADFEKLQDRIADERAATESRKNNKKNQERADKNLAIDMERLGIHKDKINGKDGEKAKSIAELREEYGM